MSVVRKIPRQTVRIEDKSIKKWKSLMPDLTTVWFLYNLVNFICCEYELYFICCEYELSHLGKAWATTMLGEMLNWKHNEVIKWKHFPCYWSFVWGIHQSLVNSLHKGQWREAFMFSLIFAWINGWVNNAEAGDLRCHHTHYDVIVMNATPNCIHTYI